MLIEPTTVPGYTLLRKIADGGSGEIYQAEEQLTHSPVVVKILHPRHHGNKAEARRIVREGKLGLRLGCQPHLVETYKSGQVNGIPYLVLEQAPGVPLRRMLQDRELLDESGLMALAVALTRVLQHIHGKGVIHKDVKPDNVMIDGLRSIKLLDLGYAETRWSIWWRSFFDRPLEGSPAYLAPELIRNRSASPATDIYALGCTLFEACTGFVPYAGLSDQEVLEKQSSPRLLPPSVVDHSQGISYASEKIILRALEKDPAARYGSADELWLELSRHPVARHGAQQA